MKLLVIGDSFGYGEELPGVDHYDPRTGKLNPGTNAWPSVLGKMIGAEVLNLSIPAGSNDRIFRLAIDNSIKEHYDIVICAWTEMPRLDLVYRGNDFPITIRSTLLKDLVHLKNYFVDYYNDRQSCQKWLAQLITLQNHFKYTGQRYLFTSMNQAWDAFVDKLDIEYLINQIDTTYYIGWPNQGLTTWMGDCPKGPGGHPLELGHQRIAEHINEYIRNLGWIS